MSEESIKAILSNFYEGQIITRHKIKINSWPWYGKLIHYIFCSWRCPACKEIKKENNNE